MASKTVQPLVIDLGIKGAEKLAGLKSSFRDLSKTVGLTDSALKEARQGIIKYAKSANQSEALIRGQIKAFEGLREQAALGGKLYLELGTQIAQLKSDLRGSSDAVEEQRAALLKAGQAAKGSAVDIRSVVAELEQLRKSARPGSSAFAQLSKDIAVLKSQLKETNVEVKKFNAGFEISQRPAMSLEKIQRQVVRLTEGLKGLNFVSDDFLNVQQRIALLGQVQSATVGRQQVIARERMFAGQAFEAFAAGPAGKLDLPKTVAALNLEINELQDRLSNTVPGQAYANLTVEIANKQRELQQVLTGSASAYDKLAAAQDRSARVAQKIADIQQYQATTVGRMAPGVGGYRDPETGAMIARGRGQVADRAAYRRRGENFVEEVVSAAQSLAAVPALPMAGTTTAPGTGAAMSGMARSRLSAAAETTRRPLAPADLPKDYLERARANLAAAPSAAVGVAPGVGFGEQVIKKQVSALKEAATAYRPYNKAIRDARAASNGSISSVNNLKNALIAKRNEVPITSAAFRRLTLEIENLDRKSERASRRMSRRRMSPMQMTQAAGAVLSGGIFGGPEGFLGGAVGALGGVGGAFAGAAIGAQIGGLRRQLGEFADYAAEIKRLEIALKGITEVQDDAVASQANYSRAVAAAADVTRDLNVPQEVAIRGITRLTAAVKGAGGGVADAELAFKNITSAITATGGGAEQVQGAVTALVQIFSKGKVSAEEINQIAERLPGTFNKIAEASGRTGPELTKALQKGQVGLNDLMKFLVQLGGEYGELAEKIAGSSEAAGQRLQVAYNNMRIEIGNALQPIGAEFQNAFVEFIQDITPVLVELLPKIAKFALNVAKNLDILAAAAGGAATAMGLLALSSVKLTGAAGFGALGALMLKTAAAAGTLTVALKGSAAAALLNPYVALGAGISAATVGIYKYYEGQKDLNSLLDDGAGSTQVIKDKITEYEDSIRKAIAKLQGINGEQKATGRDAQRLKGDIRELRDELARLKGTYKIRLDFERKGYKFDEDGLMKEFTVGGIVYGGKRGARARALRRADGTPLDGITEFEKLDGTDKDKGASKIARAMRNAEELGVRLGRTLDDLQSKINGVGDTAEEAILRKYSDALRKAGEQADDNIKAIIKLEKESGKSYPKIKESIEEVRDASKELAEAVMLEDIGKHFKEAIESAQQPLNNLMESFNTQIRERARIEELMSKGMNKSLAEQIANIETIAAKEDEVLRKKIAQAETLLVNKDLDDEQIKRLEKKIELLKKELELTPGRKESAITSAKQLEEKEDTPVDLITKGFKDAKKNLEDLVNLGNIAVNSANMIGKAFGNAFTDVVTGSATAKEALAGMMQSIGQSFIKMAAQIIAQQTTMIILGTIMKALGLVSNPIANGIPGLSTGSPSSYGGGNLFDGSVTSGLGGFRSNGGPVKSGRPYIVGERGPELFVPSSNGGVMRNEDMRQLMGRSPASNVPAMNFTFETTSIGGTEYVSREQLEAAMATTRRQAANDGAKRGMNMTLDRMQNSPRTRARVGIA
jgi:tape measure domain-containing protein